MFLEKIQGAAVLGIERAKEALTHKRMKSLYWRIAMMFLAELSAVLMEQMTGWNISPTERVFAGLVLGEISKYANTKLQNNK